MDINIEPRDLDKLALKKAKEIIAELNIPEDNFQRHASIQYELRYAIYQAMKQAVNSSNK